MELLPFRKQTLRKKGLVSGIVLWAINALNQTALLANWPEKDWGSKWSVCDVWNSYDGCKPSSCRLQQWCMIWQINHHELNKRRRCQFMLHNDPPLMLYCHDDFECVWCCWVTSDPTLPQTVEIWRLYLSLAPPPALLPVKEAVECIWAGRKYSLTIYSH